VNRRSSWLAVTMVAIATGACSGSSSNGAGPGDGAGSGDGGAEADSASPALDAASPDADAGGNPSGSDASPEASPDATMDAPVDSADGSPDATTDATLENDDASASDAASGVVPDAAPEGGSHFVDGGANDAAAPDGGDGGQSAMVCDPIESLRMAGASATCVSCVQTSCASVISTCVDEANCSDCGPQLVPCVETTCATQCGLADASADAPIDASHGSVDAGSCAAVCTALVPCCQAIDAVSPSLGASCQTTATACDAAACESLATTLNEALGSAECSPPSE
jgi:hypothetical protein